MTRFTPTQLRQMADDYDVSSLDYVFDPRICKALIQAADDCEDAERYRYLKQATKTEYLAARGVFGLQDKWIDEFRTQENRREK